jgi:hypothetical protein
MRRSNARDLIFTTVVVLSWILFTTAMLHIALYFMYNYAPAYYLGYIIPISFDITITFPFIWLSFIYGVLFVIWNIYLRVGDF